MKEKIYNLFYYTEASKLKFIGVKEHLYSGTDDEKIAFLKEQVTSDYKNCSYVPVSSKIYINKADVTDNEYKYVDSSEVDLSYFEELLKIIKAKRRILHVITPIIDNKPTIDVSTYPNYIEEYTGEDGFELDRLIKHDYFDAIKLLYNDKKYVSCTKLIVSFIDTISFLEYGDIQGSYVKWLNTYSNISSLGITPEQLWEYRNSILHMTNLESRKVLSGKEKGIHFIIAEPGVNNVPEDLEGDFDVFNLYDLITVLAFSLEQWGDDMNANPEKYGVFFKRYDTILSDRRFSYYYV